MTERMAKIIVASVGVGALFALSLFVFTAKFETERQTASLVRPKRYIPLTRVAGVKLQAVLTVPDFVSSTPYETFVQKIAWYKENNTSTISVQLFGDMMLDRNVAKAMGKKGLAYLFEHAGPQAKQRLFGGTDILVANLEGPFAAKRIYTTKSIAFRFDPLLAASLQDFGFTAVSLANNHTLDMGSANVAYTEKTLKDAGVGYFGHQTKENEASVWFAEAGLPEKVAFVGFNTTDNPLDKVGAKKALDKAKKESRYVIVMMHWGDEYKRISNTAQRALARWLIDNGATTVVGMHPHVIQEMEIYHGQPIFYSLGNFVFDQYFSTDTQEGLSVGLILKDGAIKESYLFPFYSVKSQVFAMQAEKREKFLEWMSKNSRLGSKIIR